jgi:hypothetical protein
MEFLPLAGLLILNVPAHILLAWRKPVVMIS